MILQRHILAFFLCCLFCLQSGAKDKYVLNSPDRNIVYTITFLQHSVYYQISFKNKPVVQNSRMSLVFAEGNFTDNIKIINAEFSEATEEYDLVVGKAKHVSDTYNQLIISLQQIRTPFLKLSVVIRAFNDGLAFQYQLPQWENHTSFTLLRENTEFNIAGNPLVRALLLPNYTTSHEGVYSKILLSNLAKDTLIDLPALFEFKEDVFLSVTEADLTDYAGMYLSKQSNSNELVSRLSPWPRDTAIKVKSSLPHKSPWRVMLISDRVGDLIESNIITSLNQPCSIKDVSWIKPGKTTFPWWNGNVLPDTINAPGNNFVTAQYYIDFCARNNLQYHSVVEYGLHQWYMDDGVNFQPGPNADVTKPVPGLDMKEICDYAKSKGVGVRVWVHWFSR